jgi:hypothetical protein
VQHGRNDFSLQNTFMFALMPALPCRVNLAPDRGFAALFIHKQRLQKLQKCVKNLKRFQPLACS